MSGSPPSPADDPLAADKRTLIIALVAMVLLVSIGVVSAAVFTGSACQDVSPTLTAPDGASAAADVTAGLEAAFPDADADELAALDGQLAELADQLGPITGVATVDGADRLAATPDGIATVGPVTSLLSASGAEVLARAELGTGVVVGDGDALMSLARVNDLTGQVDAFATLDATPSGALAEIGCVDTATVGTPLAFELDASDGQLLLFRAEEDGDDAEIELRDPRDGRLWFARVDVGVAPPGVTGERIDGRLGERLAVLVRRTDPGEDVPLVTAVVRTDGAPVWALGRDDLTDVEVGELPGSTGSQADPDAGALLRADAAQRLELLALDEHQILIAVTDARGEDAVTAGGTDALGPSIGPGALVALDADDGAVRWSAPLGAGVRVLAGASDAAGTWLVLADDGRVRLVGFDAVGAAIGAGPDVPLAEVVAPDGTPRDAPAEASNEGSAAARVVPTGGDGDRPSVLAVLGDALALVRTDAGQTVVEVAGSTGGAADGSLRFRDLVATEGRVHVLLAGPVDDRAAGSDERRLVVSFAAR